MSFKGTSFNINPDDLARTTKRLADVHGAIQVKLLKRMDRAVDLVYRTATAKRPMMNKAVLKKGRQTLSGRTVYTRVSDPEAKAGVPVDKGDLKASIKKEVRIVGGNVRGRIWTDSDHANAMEFGTSRVAARPFMQPAINLNKDGINRVFKIEE